MNWNILKKEGSDHYKTNGGAELIDVYKDMGLYHDWALCEIASHALRNRKSVVGEKISSKDMDKIIHYANLLKVLYET